MDIKELIKELRKDKHELYSVATDEDVRMTCVALGVYLPKSFVKFVQEFSNGAYLYMLQEVCSVGNSNPKIESIHNAYRLTKKPDKEVSIYETGEIVKLENLIPFNLDSNGNAWCFIREKENVCYLNPYSCRIFGVLGSFEDFLGILVRTKNEVIRELYDEDIILNVLQLG